MISKGTWLVLGGCEMRRSPFLPATILNVYIKAIKGFSHAHNPSDLNSTLLFQWLCPGKQLCLLEWQTEWYIVHSKAMHREGGEEPSIAGVQFTGQLVVMSS